MISRGGTSTVVVVVLASMGCRTAAPSHPVAAASTQSELRDPGSFCAAFAAAAERTDWRRCAAGGDQEAAEIVRVMDAMERICRGPMEKALADRRARFDPVRARACVDLRRTPPSRQPVEPCRAVVVGTQAIGADCASSLECQLGLLCRGVGDDPSGHCAAPKPEQATCDRWSGEQEGLYFGGHPECIPGTHCTLFTQTCVPDVAEGGACTLDECAPGLTCSSRRCQPDMIAELGQPCLADLQCRRGLYCHGASTREAAAPSIPVCAPQKTVNESCVRNSECAGKCVNGVCVSFCGSR